MDCQIASHRRFCDKYGYEYISYDDNKVWESDRNSKLVVAAHWLKVNALLDLLNQGYPWILYVDVDTVFANITYSVEDFIHYSSSIGKRSTNKKIKLGASASGTEEGTFLYLSDVTRGWNCDTILIINTKRARSFIRHLYDLRFSCPSCVGEQCAAHIALLDALVYEAMDDVRQGIIPSYAQVYADGPRKNLQCCLPRAHCAYPASFALRAKKNPHPGPWSQGCEKNWEEHLLFSNKYKSNYRRRTQFIAGDLRLRTILGIAHPVKTPDECLRQLSLNTGSTNQSISSASTDGNALVDIFFKPITDNRVIIEGSYVNTNKHFDRIDIDTLTFKMKMSLDNALFIMIGLFFLIRLVLTYVNRYIIRHKSNG